MTTPLTTATAPVPAPPYARPSPVWPNAVSGSALGPLAAPLLACVFCNLPTDTFLMGPSSSHQVLIIRILVILAVTIDLISRRRAS
jgi:hypothetical protein